jgi:hypothetical protein
MDSSLAGLVAKLASVRAFALATIKPGSTRTAEKLRKMSQLIYLAVRQGTVYFDELQGEPLGFLPETVAFWNLQKLELRHFRARKSILENLATNCPNLKWLFMQFCEVSNQGLIYLVRNLKCLQALCLDGWHIIPENSG